MSKTIDNALSLNVLTSFKSASLLESHLTAIMNSSQLLNSLDLEAYYTYALCSSLKKLAQLEGHVCRVKDENYAVHRISNDLIQSAIPYFIDAYQQYFLGNEPKYNINDLIADYSKEEIFCIRLELNHLKSNLAEVKKDIEMIKENEANLKEVPMLTKLFRYLPISELALMTRDDFESYLEDNGCSDDDIVRISTLRELIADNQVAQTAVFITQEPVSKIYSLNIFDRLNAARVQLLLQDLPALDRMIGVV